MSGDVPIKPGLQIPLFIFSPRERGCSDLPANGDYVLLHFPRVSGDVPPIEPYSLVKIVFSPRERGCSEAAKKNPAAMVIFPA